MGWKTSLMVGGAVSIGALVAWSMSACELPLECWDGSETEGGCPPYPSTTSATTGTGAGPAIDGVLQQGAILCSDCARSPFCFDTTENPPVYVYITDPMLGCPGGLFPSQAATRRAVVDGEEVDETFYCVPPTGVDEFNVPETYCDTNDLPGYSFVHPCADADPNCLPEGCEGGGGGEGGSGGEGGGGAPCIEKTEMLELCGRDEDAGGVQAEGSYHAAAARKKVIAAVEGWQQHPNVPGNLNADPNDPDEPPPGRYCFVTCFNPDYVIPDYVPCDPADDPWVSTTSTFVRMEPDSEVSVTVRTTDETGNPQVVTSSVNVEGAMAVDIPRECRRLDGADAVSCAVTIGSAWLKGSSDLVVQGFTISDLNLTNRFNWSASATAQNGITTVTLSSAPALVTGEVDLLGLVGMRPELAGFSGTIDWNRRTYESSTVFRSPFGNGNSTVLDLYGTIPNIPPLSDAGRDQVVECTGNGRAEVTLTARGTDPDGANDINAYVWGRRLESGWVVSSGPTLTTPFPLGRTNVVLTALDRARAKDTDGMEITVVDTLAPGFSRIDVPAGSLWPADERWHLFRLGEEINATVADVCDASPTLRIIDVEGDPSTDFTFDDETVCVRADSTDLLSYTVTLEAVDSSGNDAREYVRITNADLAPALASGDPRCP